MSIRGNKTADHLYLWQKALAEVFFPRRTCVCCGGFSPGSPLCPECLASCAALRSCPDCATFIAQTETDDYRCANCRGTERGFTLARAALPYEGKLREQLLAFKYQDRVGLRRSLADLLLLAYRRYYQELSPDAVLPLPLSRERLSSRSYNQAELLSCLLAHELALPHRPELLSRVLNTRPLFELKKSEREAELRGAFRASQQAQGLRLLLVDDIFTTGATASAAALALAKQGAAAVYVLTVAAVREI